jgi:glycosyltransferase involved in cell wall biosynthesis
MKLSTVILTLNNESFIRTTIESIKPHTDEIVIVDSFSTDKTLEIAREYTDKIFSIETCGYDVMRNYAIDCCSGDWVLQLDADEIVSNDVRGLKDFLKGTLFNAFVLPRFQITNIDPMTYKTGDGLYPDFQFRVIRKDSAARYDGVVHEIIKDKNPVTPLSLHLFHFNLMTMSFEEREAKGNKYNGLRQGAANWNKVPFAIVDFCRREEINYNVMELLQKINFRNDERVINS